MAEAIHPAFSNENIKHTKGAFVPESSRSGEAIERAKVDAAVFGPKGGFWYWFVPVVIGGAATVGYWLWRRRSEPGFAYAEDSERAVDHR